MGLLGVDVYAYHQAGINSTRYTVQAWRKGTGGCRALSIGQMETLGGVGALETSLMVALHLMPGMEERIQYP